MIILEKIQTGHPKELLTNLKRRVTQLANGNSWIRIGITGNPQKRWDQYMSSGPCWDRMELLYKTSSYTHIVEMEAQLISHLYHNDKLWNFTGGGGGSIWPEQGYYLYCLVRRDR